jgi:S1-C subfamily serine protease
MSTYGRLPHGARLALALALAGCGAKPAPVAATPAPSAPAQAAPAKRAPPPGQIAREDLDAALVQGPPWLLRRVPIEEVIRAGAFIGWKILALPEGWSSVDLKPGDVVTKANGVSLERPDDLFAAWRTAASATELRIAYEREGSARELVLPIAGAPSKETLKAIEGDAPPRRPAAGSRQRATTVIEEDDGTPSDSDDP